MLYLIQEKLSLQKKQIQQKYEKYFEKQERCSSCDSITTSLSSWKKGIL